MEIIVSLIGVIVGWTLTQLTNFFNVFRNDKRTFKETLYYLLELYFQIVAAKNIEFVSETYMDAIKDSEEIFLNKDDEIKLSIALKSLIREFYFPIIEKELFESKDKYDSILNKLSSVSPIMAYRLKGKDKIIKYLNEWNSFTNKTFSEAKSTNIEELKFLNIKPEIESHLLNEAIIEIKELIIETAKKIGRKTLNEVKNTNIFSENKFKIETSERMYNYIKEKIVPLIKKNYEN